ncbi:MAG: hypothetical protein BWY17_03587 [Deltaproteobacteria bacterium ADurb.Bin207]|nr:MAG: hypothetical protein BWY17_03587 [Deltaproteobacteria bacterium ADurb.Bin207]
MLVLIIAPISTVATLGWALSTHSAVFITVSAISTVFVAAIYIGLVLPIRYGLDATRLVVRFGLVRQQIELNDISSVQPTNNPLSSPALSLDRLQITYGKGGTKTVMISPRDRAQFLDILAERANLRRHGDMLSRE